MIPGGCGRDLRGVSDVLEVKDGGWSQQLWGWLDNECDKFSYCMPGQGSPKAL